MTSEDANRIERLGRRARSLSSLLASLASRPPRLVTLAPKVYAALRAGGASGLRRHIEYRTHERRARTAYREWVATHDTLTDEDRRSIVNRIARLDHTPLISVVMPVYDVDERWLRRAVESVRRQLYTRWELCIADDASRKPHVRSVLEEYAARDPRIKIVFRTQNGHISRASNSALELATGEFVALLDHDDELPEHALYTVAAELDAHPEADLIYSDEDKIDEHGARSDPHFKPDFDPDLFRSLNMISHLGVYRTSVVREVGGFRAGYEGSQDYDLALRVVERVPAAHIRHIPRILYHWRVIPGSVALDVNEKEYALNAARRAIASHLERTGESAEVEAGRLAFHKIVYPLPSTLPLVTLVVQARRGHEARARRTIDEMLARTAYPSSKIIVTGEAGKSTELNAAVATRGEIICFVSDDLEVINADWLKEMVSHALRSEVGAVGAKLCARDDTIRNAGLILGVGRDIAAPAHEGIPRRAAGHIGRAQVIQNFSAVSGDCLVTRRAVFDEVGGFRVPDFAARYRDVDYCLRLHRHGYRIVWTPYAELYQRRTARAEINDDSSTTESLMSAEARRAREYMRAQWGDLLDSDPHYNPNLNSERADFTIASTKRDAGHSRKGES